MKEIIVLGLIFQEDQFHEARSRAIPFLRALEIRLEHYHVT